MKSRCVCGRITFLPSYLRDAPGNYRCIGCDLAEHLCRCRPIREPQVEE